MTSTNVSGLLKNGSWPELILLIAQVSCRSPMTPFSMVNWKSRVAVKSLVVTTYVLGTDKCHGASGIVSAVKSLRCHANWESQCFCAAGSRSLKRMAMELSLGMRRPSCEVVQKLVSQMNSKNYLFHVMMWREKNRRSLTLLVSHGGRYEYIAIGASSGRRKAATKTISIMPV